MAGRWNLEGLAADRRRAMAFLESHLPESDLDCYPRELFLAFADQALSLRREAPWCGALDWEIFCHYVLFPRVNDEDLSFHRGIFREALWPRVRSLPTAEERVLEANRWCQEQAAYEMQDERTASPLTVYRSGSGRCGEESAFLVSALRSVGVAARQVYCPRWSHCDDNHAWVEALCGGRWRFLGACEPEPVLDRGWFNSAAARAMLVHSRVFGEGSSPLHGELLCREGGVSWYNQTARYAQVRPCLFRALLPDGHPAAGAVFRLQVLNEAGFHTIASLAADGQGEAMARLGLGDLHVLAERGDLAAEGDCGEGPLTLRLAPPSEGDAPWREFSFRPPAGLRTAPAGLDAGQRSWRERVRQEGNALREARRTSLERRGPPRWADLLRAARGNAGEIAAFLERDADPRREALVRTLTDKDLRDARDRVLEDHLRNAPDPGDLPPEIYFPYVLCPRVELEPLRAWRGALRGAFSPAEQQAFRQDPAALWAALERPEAPERTYANLVWTPEAAWRHGRWDERSRRLLYAALLRTMGVPARLRPTDGAPEFWRQGQFHPATAEEAGTLRVLWEDGGASPQSWTLSRREGARWRLLSGRWEEGEAIRLPTGQYRLLTALRLPNGSQLAAMRELCLRAGEERTAVLRRLTCGLEEMLLDQELPAMSAATLDGEAVPDLCRMGGGPRLLLWLEEGGEPTEHVLHELADCRRALEASATEVVFLLRSRGSLDHPAIAGLLARWPGIRVLLDDWAYDLETAARRLGCDPDTPPLAVACGGTGRALCAFSGYRVGGVELLARAAAWAVLGV